VCRDFNAVCNVEERWSNSGSNVTHDIQHFSLFIDDNGLIDLPCAAVGICGSKGMALL
jgi:hypothetical protein